MTISEFSFGPENIGASRPLATLSSFSPEYSGKPWPVIVVSPSGKFPSKGSSTKDTPIATAKPTTRTTAPAIMKFLFNCFLSRNIIIQQC